MNELPRPPGRLLRPEGKIDLTRDENGDANDQLHEAKALFPWLLVAVVSAIVIILRYSWN